MTRLSLIALLTLTACARPDACATTRAEVERCLTSPDPERCICNAPTASLPATMAGESDDRRITRPDPVRPEPPTVEPPEPPTVEPPKPEPKPEPEPEGPQKPGPEPKKDGTEAAQKAHDAWREARDAWKEAGGQWP